MSPKEQISRQMAKSELLFRAGCSSRQPLVTATTLSSRHEAAAEFVREFLDLGLRDALVAPSMGDEALEVARLEASYGSGALAQLTVADLAERARRSDRVEITTMTSSKGLEFDTVVVLGVDEGQLPFFTSSNDPEQMAEDRRKLYVSMTRAKEHVYIHYSGFVEWQKGTTSQKGPSSFLRDMRLL